LPQRCVSSASRVSGILSTLLLRLELSLNQPWVVYAGTKFAVRAGLTPPLFSKIASNHWDTQIKSTRPHTHDAFQNEFVRQTETSRDQISNASRKISSLLNLAEDIAQ
jgi:hypothetical protein